MNKSAFEFAQLDLSYQLDGPSLWWARIGYGAFTKTVAPQCHDDHYFAAVAYLLDDAAILDMTGNLDAKL